MYCLFPLKTCLAPLFCLPPCHNSNFPAVQNLRANDRCFPAQPNCAFKYSQVRQTEVQEPSIFSLPLTAGIYAAPSIGYTELLNSLEKPDKKFNEAVTTRSWKKHSRYFKSLRERTPVHKQKTGKKTVFSDLAFR